LFSDCVVTMVAHGSAAAVCLQVDERLLT